MRILIIRFSSIGDIISTTALPRVIRKNLPEARLDYLTSIEFRDIIAYNPNIDNVRVFNRKYSRLRDLLNLAKEIKKQKYDLIIDAHNTLRTKIIKLINKNTPFITFNKNRLQKFLLNNFKINFLKNIPLNVIRHGNALSNFGINYDKKGTELILSKELKNKTSEHIKKLNKPFVVLVPGAAWKLKQWSKEKYRELASKIQKQGYEVLVVGADKDKLFDSEHDFCGKLSLIESIAFMENSTLVIGNDTGLIHAAEAIGKDVVMISGPTSSEYGMYPFREKSQVVFLDMWCRPCSSYGSKPCIRFSNACLKNISVDMVFDKFTTYIDNNTKKDKENSDSRGTTLDFHGDFKS